MSKNELTKRYFLLVIGLFFAAMGVAAAKQGALGVSPVSSVANVLSYRFTALSLGWWLIIWNGILILGQLLIRRKDFELIQLLQIPVSFLFGYFTDFGTWCLSRIPVNIYPVQIFFVLCGTVLLGFGVSVSVIANVIMNAGEAFVKAVADRLHMSFGNVKILLDVLYVALSVLLSLLFFDGRIVGTREGTIISAFLTGIMVKFFTGLLKEPLEKFCRKKTINTALKIQ